MTTHLSLVTFVFTATCVAAPVPRALGPTVEEVKPVDADRQMSRVRSVLAADGGAYFFRDLPKWNGKLGQSRTCKIGKMDRRTAAETVFEEVEVRTSVEFDLQRAGALLGHKYTDSEGVACYSLYDTATGKRVRTTKEAAGTPFALTPEVVAGKGDRGFVVNRGGAVQSVDLAKAGGDSLPYLDHLPTYGDAPVEWASVRDLQLTADDTRLVWMRSARLNPDTEQEIKAGNVIVYDLKADKLKSILPLYDHRTEQRLQPEHLKTTSDGSSVAFTASDYSDTPKGAREGATRQTLRLMDLASGKTEFSKTFDERVHEFAFDASGRFLVAVVRVNAKVGNGGGESETLLWFLDLTTHEESKHRVAGFSTETAKLSASANRIVLIESTGGKDTQPEVRVFDVTYPLAGKKPK